MNENERKVVVRRMLLLIAVACTIMGLYTFRLIFLQLVNGDDFKAKATNTTDYKFTVTAARGDIVDSTGKHIATTSTGYNVVLNKLQMGDQDLDTMLQQIVELCARTMKNGWTPCSSASRMPPETIPLRTAPTVPATRKRWQT